MTLIRLSSGRVHLRDGDTTACGMPASAAVEVSRYGKPGMCTHCLRAMSIRGTLTDSWKNNKPVNRKALLRELVELRAKRGG